MRLSFWISLNLNKWIAVLTVNEVFAIHTMNLVQKLGIKVPEEISFIGFTDGILSKYSSPKLTSVAQHGDQMGELAAKLLIDRIESEIEDEEVEEVFKTEIIKATLIERESTIKINNT